MYGLSSKYRHFLGSFLDGQESMCLFEYKATGVLPFYCDCEKRFDWYQAKTTEIHGNRGVTYSQGIEDYSPSVLSQVDAMTALDRELTLVRSDMTCNVALTSAWSWLNACVDASSMVVLKLVLDVTLPRYSVRYRRAVERLMRELDELGTRFGKKILCDTVRKELQQKAGIA